MLFWTLWTCANHSESFVTWRHCVWWMICDRSEGGGRESAPTKVLICRKSWQNLWKSGKNPGKFGHRLFDTFVLIVWWMRLTVEIRLNLTFSSLQKKNTWSFFVWPPKKFFRGSLRKFRHKSFAPPNFAYPYTYDLWRKISRKAYVCRRLTESEKHLLWKLCSLHLLRIRNSLQLVCLIIAVPFILASIWFWVVKWSKREVLTGSNILRGNLAMRYLRSLAELPKQQYSFMSQK